MFINTKYPAWSYTGEIQLKKKPKRWTESEIQIIKKRSHLSAKALVKIMESAGFNRTFNAVQTKLQEVRGSR